MPTSPGPPDELVFAPGSWGARKAGRNVVASGGAITLVAVPLLLGGLRSTGLLPGLILIGVVVAITVPAALLWVRFGVRPMRVVITDDVVELRREDRVRRRLLRRHRLRAVRFMGEGAGRRFGPMQLVISDGRSAIRLTDGRWLDQHAPILAALDLRAGEVSQSDALRDHPQAFGWVERHPALFVLLVIVLPIVLIIVGAGVVGAFFG